MDDKTIKVKWDEGWPETTLSNTGHSPVLHQPLQHGSKPGAAAVLHCHDSDLVKM